MPFTDAKSKQELAESGENDPRLAGLDPKVVVCLEAIMNAKGLLDNPIARRRFGRDTFYRETVESLNAALQLSVCSTRVPLGEALPSETAKETQLSETRFSETLNGVLPSSTELAAEIDRVNPHKKVGAGQLAEHIADYVVAYATAAPVSEEHDLAKLASEFRMTMPRGVLELWAADVSSALIEGVRHVAREITVHECITGLNPLSNAIRVADGDNRMKSDAMAEVVLDWLRDSMPITELEKGARLASEYRPTMHDDVAFSWGSDVPPMLRWLESEIERVSSLNQPLASANNP